MAPTLLILRPEPGASRFAAAARARWGPDLRLIVSPVMRIERRGDLPPLDDVRTLIFTSRNGVAAFAAASDRRDIPAFAVGDATAERARAAGLSVTACGGDARDLIVRVAAAEPATPCLHLRGEHAAVDLAAALNQAGIETREAVLYRQVAQEMTAAARAALDGAAPVLVPLFSARSARLFFAAGAARAPLFAAAISANVAAEVPDERVRLLSVAERPDGDGVMMALDELMDAAKRLEGNNPAQ